MEAINLIHLYIHIHIWLSQKSNGTIIFSPSHLINFIHFEYDFGQKSMHYIFDGQAMCYRRYLFTRTCTCNVIYSTKKNKNASKGQRTSHAKKNENFVIEDSHTKKKKHLAVTKKSNGKKKMLYLRAMIYISYVWYFAHTKTQHANNFDSSLESLPSDIHSTTSIRPPKSHRQAENRVKTQKTQERGRMARTPTGGGGDGYESYIYVCIGIIHIHTYVCMCIGIIWYYMCMYMCIP